MTLAGILSGLVGTAIAYGLIWIWNIWRSRNDGKPGSHRHN